MAYAPTSCQVNVYTPQIYHRRRPRETNFVCGTSMVSTPPAMSSDGQSPSSLDAIGTFRG